MSIRLIGRKQYHAWSDNFTIGLGIFTSQWSDFVPNPPKGAYAELFDICDIAGELVSRSIGVPKRVLYGQDVNSLITNDETWVPMNKQRLSSGFVGRRLLMSWNEESMLSIDKIVGSPSRFGISPEKGKSAMLYNVEEILGELVEVKHGRPEGKVFGRDANYLVVSRGSWIIEGEDIRGALIAHLKETASNKTSLSL